MSNLKVIVHDGYIDQKGNWKTPHPGTVSRLKAAYREVIAGELMPLPRNPHDPSGERFVSVTPDITQKYDRYLAIMRWATKRYGPLPITVMQKDRMASKYLDIAYQALRRYAPDLLAQ